MEHEMEHQNAGIQRYWKLVHKQQELDSSNMKLKGNEVIKARQKIQLISVNERCWIKAAF